MTVADLAETKAAEVIPMPSPQETLPLSPGFYTARQARGVVRIRQEFEALYSAPSRQLLPILRQETPLGLMFEPQGPNQQ